MGIHRYEVIRKSWISSSKGISNRMLLIRDITTGNCTGSRNILLFNILKIGKVYKWFGGIK